MKLNWAKWGLEFWQSLARHIGTAGMTWLGLGVKEGKIAWHDLWIAILVGAILPTVFTTLQTKPAPDDDDAAAAPAPAPPKP